LKTDASMGGESSPSKVPGNPQFAMTSANSGVLLRLAEQADNTPAGRNGKANPRSLCSMAIDVLLLRHDQFIGPIRIECWGE
jgi:hypothetical protein